MSTFLRRLTKTDKTLLAIILLNAGVKARIRVGRCSLRVCFVGAQADVLSALNDNGFRTAAGRPFDAASFNQPHEIFVHTLAA